MVISKLLFFIGNIVRMFEILASLFACHKDVSGIKMNKLCAITINGIVQINSVASCCHDYSSNYQTIKFKFDIIFVMIGFISIVLDY